MKQKQETMNAIKNDMMQLLEGASAGTEVRTLVKVDDESSAILKDINDAFSNNSDKFKTKAELILHRKQRELKEEIEKKKIERLMQQNGL